MVAYAQNEAWKIDNSLPQQKVGIHKTKLDIRICEPVC